MQNFIQNVLGATDVATYVNSLFFAFVGVIFSLLLEVVNRDPNSPSSPICFSMSYLMSDNFKRLMASFFVNVIAVLLAIRFTPELIGVQLSPIVALGIGVGFDKLVNTIRTYLSKK